MSYGRFPRLTTEEEQLSSGQMKQNETRWCKAK